MGAGTGAEIEDIYFKDIKVLNGPFPVSIIRGYEMRLEESRPRESYFDNIEILGQKCNSVFRYAYGCRISS